MFTHSHFVALKYFTNTNCQFTICNYICNPKNKLNSITTIQNIEELMKGGANLC